MPTLLGIAENVGVISSDLFEEPDTLITNPYRTIVLGRLPWAPEMLTEIGFIRLRTLNVAAQHTEAFTV